MKIKILPEKYDFVDPEEIREFYERECCIENPCEGECGVILGVNEEQYKEFQFFVDSNKYNGHIVLPIEPLSYPE